MARLGQRKRFLQPAALRGRKIGARTGERSGLRVQNLQRACRMRLRRRKDRHAVPATATVQRHSEHAGDLCLYK